MASEDSKVYQFARKPMLDIGTKIVVWLMAIIMSLGGYIYTKDQTRNDERIKALEKKGAAVDVIAAGMTDIKKDVEDIAADVKFLIRREMGDPGP